MKIQFDDLILKFCSSTDVFYTFCQLKQTTLFVHSWKADLKWVKNCLFANFRSYPRKFWQIFSFLFQVLFCLAFSEGEASPSHAKAGSKIIAKNMLKSTGHSSTKINLRRNLLYPFQAMYPSFSVPLRRSKINSFLTQHIF